jgi:hypothetical protein
MRRGWTGFSAVVLAVLLCGCEALFPGAPTLGPGLISDDFADEVGLWFDAVVGEWEIVDGQLHATSTEPDEFDEQRARGVVAGGEGWTDYEIRVDLDYRDPDSVYGAVHRVVIVRAQGGTRRICFVGTDHDMHFEFLQNGRPVIDVPSSGRVLQPLPRRCTVRVRVVGDTYTAFVDDVQVLETEYSLWPTGTAGIEVRIPLGGGEGWIAGNAEHIWFDNFSVREIE